MNDHRQQDHRAKLWHQESRAERKAVEQAVQRNPQEGGDSHLVNIALPFFAGMDKNEALQDKYQQEPRQDRPADIFAKHPGLGQHMKKNRAQENSGAKAQEQRQRSLR